MARSKRTETTRHEYKLKVQVRSETPEKYKDDKQKLKDAIATFLNHLELEWLYADITDIS